MQFQMQKLSLKYFCNKMIITYFINFCTDVSGLGYIIYNTYTGCTDDGLDSKISQCYRVQ